MTVQKVRELCDAEPFKAFLMHLPDGRHVAVEHPDFVAFGMGGRFVSVFKPDESESFVDMMLVSDITIKASARRDGRKD